MKKALGRGLSALIPDTYAKEAEAEAKPQAQATSSPGTPAEPVSQKGLAVVSVSKIKVNRDQPRKEFAADKISELAASIQQKGILQPIVVAKIGDDQYEIICGERRFRAAQLCGLDEVPVVIKDIAPNDFLEWALIENIQRQDLNALEEAEAYQKLLEEKMISHEQLATRVGKSRTAISNTIRLLKLPEDIQSYVIDGRLAEGHARALLGMLSPAHQRQLTKKIVEDNLSVRQVEAIVSRSNAHKRRAKKARNLSPEIVDLENQLVRHMGTQVKIYPRKNGTQGRVELFYHNLDDLDRILEKVGLPKNT